MNQANQVFILTFCVILTGFLLKKFNFIKESEGKTISKFLMHTTFPALMVISTARIKIEYSLLLLPLFCIAISIIMIGVAYLVFAKYPPNLRGVLMMGMGGTNVGLFGFPIIEELFGKEALAYAIMYDIGNTIIVFGVIYPIGRYFSPLHEKGLGIKPILKKIFSLPPFIGMLIGLIINLLAIPMPEIFYDFLGILAKGNKPIVLLLMGIYLSFSLDKNQIIGISKVLYIRYAVSIIVILILYYFLPINQMRNVLMMCIILPMGMTILPFSDEMNYSSKMAGSMVNLSLIISFALMWVLVSLLL
ncbi:MAG: AEC family transporter [Bacteroidota bacterium]